jgi:hypothetical protein
VINPIEPGLEIVPDNPDYTLDPDGLGGSGKGIIGEAPIEIPYTITYSGAQKDAAIAVTVKVTGPTQSLNGVDYCAFSGNGFTVPIPGNVLVGKSQTLMAHNCKGEVLSIPARHPCGRVGQNEFRRDRYVALENTADPPVRYG